MPNNTSNLSVPIKGMNTDVHPINLTEQGYDYALNSVVEEFNGNGFPLLQNESSTLLCTNFPTDYKVVGVVNIVEQDRKILFLTNTNNGFSQIGEIIGRNEDCDKGLIDRDEELGYCGDCETVYSPEANPLELQNLSLCCEYHIIATQSCFNFSIDNPIRAVYRLEDCGISIYFTDNINPYRYIEFEYIDDNAAKPLKIKDKFRLIVGFNPDCEDPIYGNQIDCNKILIDPILQIPTLEFIDTVEGGSLDAGVYQFFIAYSDVNGNKRTPYFNATNPIPIRTRDVTFETNYSTDRAIKIKVSDISLSTPYEYYNIVVAKTINNVTSFELVGTFPVTNQTVVYTGNDDSVIQLTSNDVFELKVYYSKAKITATSNNFLFWAGLEESKKLNIQPIASGVKLYWQTMSVPEAIYRNPIYTNKFRGYMRDEVYALGLVLIFDNGEESAIGHIPGRSPTFTDLEIVNNSDSVQEGSCDDCSENPSSDVQVVITSPNTVVCTSTTPEIPLDLNNRNQAEDCPLIPYSQTGCTKIELVDMVAPIVNAGADQTISYLGSVSLNGSATPVSGSNITSYQWQQLSGPNQVVISNNTLANTYFENYNAGVYVFRLCATDNFGNRGFDDITITVNIPVNQPPICDPGSDKIVTLPDTVSYLNGANSSDDEGIFSYQWSQVAGPNTANIINPTFAYTNITGLVVGVYEFKLIVCDVRNCCSESTTLIHVVDDPSSFPPNCTNLLYPINGSITSSFQTVILDWEDAPYATGYDIYMRTDAGSFGFIGSSIDSNFSISNLIPNTIYHWYIVPKNDAGDAVNCDICYRSFVTPTQSSVENCQKQRWEVYNTASVIESPMQPFKDCEETCWQYGQFAYWESIERYPNIPEIWGDLCNQPIRHHKFPDSLVTHIHDGQNGNLDYNRSNIMFPIGIRVDYQSVRDAIQKAIDDKIITVEDAVRIKGYKIVRGNRFQNKSVVAKGLLYDVNQYQRKKGGGNFDPSPIYFSNYPYNDLRPNPFITDDFRNYDDHDDPEGADLPFVFSNRYTFHSPDTHFTEPSIGTKLKLETVEYGMSEGYFTICKNQARQRFLSNTSYTIAFATGIVATLIKKEPLQEKEYMVKGLNISGMGIASGVFGPHLPYQSGPGAAIVPESILDTSLNLSRVASINVAHEVRTQTIQGKESDWANPVFLAIRKPFLVPLFPLILANVVTGFLSSVLMESKVILDLIESLTPYRDWTVQFNSVGKYNSYIPIQNLGNKIRAISDYSYLKGENASISEKSETNPSQFVSIKMNNWNRESSLYLKYLGNAFPNASTLSGIQDESRYTLEDGDVGENLDKRVYRSISSYYASIKEYVPDQYGSIFNLDYISTGSYVIPLTENVVCRTVYGGDTFINRFALKRKVPYFLFDTFGMQDGTDFNYGQYPNLGVPRHYYNSTTGVGSEFDNIGDILSLVTPQGIADFLGRPKSIRDANTSKFFYQNGYIYLYHYGIPYFLVESDVNVDYRHAENLREKAFYPIQSDLDFWLQQENVPIREDNYYLYNNTYSKQNREHSYFQYPRDFEPGRMCRVAHPNRIIYSNGKNWLSYKANDYYDFPLASGAVVGVDGIENDKVLVRSENTTQVFNAYITIPTNTQSIQVGTGGMFSSKPQEYAHTTLGYAGTQHISILHTEFGHIWVDAKRGQVFNLNGNNLDEISRDGMKNWFKENLPFRILKYFPNLPLQQIDNNYNGIGLALGFDKRFNRFLLTKRDYNMKNIGDLCYDGINFRDIRTKQQVINEYTSNGWTYIGDRNCRAVFQKEEITLPPTTDIYAFFDTTSMQISDGEAAAAALKSWFNVLKAANPQYQGHLYILPTLQEGYVYHLQFVERGSGIQIANNPSIPADWFANVAILPPNFDRFSDNPNPSWIPPTDVILLAFVDEAETIGDIGYHDAIENSFGGQPTQTYQDHYILFRSLYDNFNSFKGVLYPIVRPTVSQTKALILQGLACIEGTTLTPAEIAETGTTINVSSILTSNPYQNFILPDSTIIEGLKEYQWRGVYNKTSPASAVFNSSTFAQELTDLLDLSGPSTEIIIEEYEFPIIEVGDPNYFEDVSWTVSYNFYTKSWISFHSYLPSYYIDGIDYFSSGLNLLGISSLWLHNTTNKSYQVFYGRVKPWIIQTITKGDINKNNLNSVEFGLDAIRYHNEYDPFYTNNITFNKAVVSNQNQTSGLLNLEYNNKSNLNTLISYPVANVDNTVIRITNADGVWRFNQFYDISTSRSNNIPLWLNNTANSEKRVNPLAVDYQIADLNKRRIRGEWCRIRLTNDEHTNYKMIFKYLTNHSVKIYR